LHIKISAVNDFIILLVHLAFTCCQETKTKAVYTHAKDFCW